MNNLPNQTVVEISNVCTRFGDHIVHSGVDLEVRKAEIFALIGGSGSGKSTLLREMIMLQRPDSGSIQVLGEPLEHLGEQQATDLRKRWGVMFQHGGLFGSLTVQQNIGLPMREHTNLDDALIDEIADWKLTMTGLKSAVGAQYPSELSGGMLKRASLARALVLDPELLFLDEPTTGLDPESASEIDELVCKLRNQSGLTIVMITHDLDLLWQVSDRVAVLANGKVQAMGSMQELSTNDNPAIKVFFDGPRGRAAQDQEQRLPHTSTNAAKATNATSGSSPSKPK
ncbi:ABC transporter ATP-binding protein [Solimicrobium silvestre]|uniref:ABC-type transport system involved in resistance to organic solvents ATPase component n=1 Tax=Solimicrobium silvestre TaxID=2099400 RepID=A0A2S9GUL2_9BURK|nr:ATP-binding cassette domain-containing protein [Solimicrobium silvestre]PRC91422.1 ABC-type transport system involved in resistance to organic solvents ATPase component [Solimicrobium silvestre]